MKKLQPRIIGTNIFGALGYVLTLFVWTLLFAVIVTLLTEQQVSLSADTTTPVALHSGLAGLAVGAAYFITAVMAVLTLAIVVLFPYLVGRLSSVLLKRLLLLLKIAPTKRHMFLAKSIVLAVPLAGFFVLTMLLSNFSMTFSVIYVISVGAAVLALVLFLLQLIIARALHIPERSVW